MSLYNPEKSITKLLEQNYEPQIKEFFYLVYLRVIVNQLSQITEYMSNAEIV